MILVNKGMLTVGIILLAIIGLLLINIISNYSTGSELDYYLVKETAKAAMERTHRWLDRCFEAKTNPKQALFPIVQGAFFDDFCDDPEHYMDGRWTHVIEPFAPPADWRIYRSYDFGYNKPFSCAGYAGYKANAFFLSIFTFLNNVKNICDSSVS